MENAYVLQVSDSRFKDLFLCFCGYAQCDPTHYFGPAARPNYIIHFILSGKGIYQVGQKKYKLKAGQGFLIEPDELTFYQADEKDPWTYCWIGFGGTKAEEFVRDIGLNSEQVIFQSEYGNEIRKIILNMLKLKEMTLANQYKLQSLLYEFFALLIDDSKPESEKEESKESVYIRHAIQYIRNHYMKELRVEDIAKYVCVNRSYLYKLFQKNLKMSPKEFITSFRISRGKELLSITDLSIEEVANQCGYADVRAFSRTLKKMTGVTPSRYRVEHRDKLRHQLKLHETVIEKLMDQEDE